ncbi:MAG TPA: hypothetical protein VKE74_33420, partial [Gemmataceae bacterium]|nr:hypothetical protein [Gemmataceae bacterium]
MRRPAVLLCVGITAVCAGGLVGKTRRIGGPEMQEPGGAEVRARTRQEFAGAMAKVTPGLAEKDVLALLGKPDDVKTRTDPGGISTTRTREIWRYGTDGHLSFPTLGCVYIDTDGKAQYVYGGRGQPPDPALLPEAELRPLLRLIDTAPSYNAGYHYDPLAVIRAVNALQALGKEKALAAIAEYLRVSSHFHDPGREGVFLVLRVLFDVPPDPGHMPHMSVGAPWPEAPADPKRLPRFPILLQDGVPLLLVAGYTLAGRAEQPESHVEYFRKHGRLRDGPLVPAGDPLGLLSPAVKAAGWPPGTDDGHRASLLIANQLLALVDTVYRREADRHGIRFWPDGNPDREWKVVAAAVAKLDIRWDRGKQRYTFKDGTSLSERARNQYRRHIWKLDGLNGEAEVILERIDQKSVRVSVEWSGRSGNTMPAYTLKVFAVKDRAKPLAQLSPSSVRVQGGAEAFVSQSFQVELPERAEVQARLTVGER